jgi:putative transposase
MLVLRTERIWVKQSVTLMLLAHKAKNLYNYANYIIKFQLEKNNYFTSAFELMDILRYHPTYTSLPAHTAQQTIKFLVKNWKGYFRAVKEWKKNAKKFLASPRPPKYKRKRGLHILYFTNNQVKLRGGQLFFPKQVGLVITTRLVKERVKQARLIPKGTAFLLEIVYEKEVKHTSQPVKNILAIDLGVNNLITGVSTVGSPFLINGRPLKAFNQLYNKRKAQLQSTYKKQKFSFSGLKLRKLMDERERIITNYLHKASRLVINHCLLHHIDTLVIGYNKGWKQKVKMGKRNNQNFVSIPFHTLVMKLHYKAEEQGIRVELVEEEYTSKCSFLDNEPLRKHLKYLGKRLHRGLFRSKHNILLNADCNAAGNIGRKVFPSLFNSGTVDAVIRPCCLTV